MFTGIQVPILLDDLRNNNRPTEAAAETLPRLYKLDSKGKLRSWQIGVAPSETGYAVNIEAGLVDGAKVANSFAVSEGKNIGRANETTAFDQAVLEARSKWNAQVRSGYCERPEDCKQAVLGSGIPAPMLAQKYSPDGGQEGSKTLAKMKLEGAKIHVQPKFDGNRCLIRVDADAVELYTRKGDRMLSVPHIEEQIRAAYDALRVDREYILDGELYTDAFSFNTLNGLIRREDKTAEHLEQLKLVDYHLYDRMSDKSDYSIRYDLIATHFANDRNVRLVPSFEIEATDAAIREKMEQFLADGYEGLMIRRLDTPYENKRSWSLCKYKDFMDAEYRVVDIVEDVRGVGIIGAFVLELETPTIDRDGREIRTFNAGIKDLSHEESRKMLEAKAEYIGRLATVEFFSVSGYGVPRFPKLKGFRADV